MRDIYILLTDTGSVLTRVIKRFTNNPYNHVSIAFDEDLNKLYSFGRLQPNNPFFGGFVEESIYSGTFKRFEKTTCMILRLSIGNEEYDLLKHNLKTFTSNTDGYTYNLVGLIGAAFNVKVPRKSAYFCSEFEASLLYDSNLTLLDKQPHCVRPYDFRSVDGVEIVYEGLLSDYAMEMEFIKGT